MTEDNDSRAKTEPTEEQRADYTSRDEWEALSNTPAFTEQFGYEWTDLEVIPADDDGEKTIVLPANEDLLADDAFMVVGSDAVCDVVAKR
jgi:hypothetical protein